MKPFEMKPFQERYQESLADKMISRSLLAFQRDWQLSRQVAIQRAEQETGKSFSELRGDLAATKRSVRAEWDERIDQFVTMARGAGAKVVRCGTGEEAVRYIIDLCRRRGVTLVVKGKSMASEEIELNRHLHAAGITPVETDLGEWILQLASQSPSHLVMPAIHMPRHQVAELLSRTLGRLFDPDDIPSMVRAARVELRDAFLSAGVGLTGANALVAQTGSILLVCNEGNNRMCVALPPIHVVVAGIEKLVPTTRDALEQVRLLTASATGQHITTYVNLVAGPRPGQEQHIVLVDNGRRDMAADPRYVDALSCIRCGACANVCPPYQVVGGHGFGHIYTGPIGLVITPFHHALDDAAGPQALCVTCGACSTVCPADIPLAEQLLSLRSDVVTRPKSHRLRRVIFAAFRRRRLVAMLVKIGAVASLPFRRRSGLQIPLMRRHTKWRTPPVLPFRSARQLLRNRPARPAVAQTEITGKTVAVLLQCVSDRLRPHVAVSTVELLQAAGALVETPTQQHCCGLPAFDGGDWRSARKMAEQTITTFEGHDLIVTPAPSCVVMVHEYRKLFEDSPEWLRRAARLADRTQDLISCLLGPARLPEGSLATGEPITICIDRFCQSTNVLRLGHRTENLVRHLTDAVVATLAENEVCCGFGGSTSFLAPEVSQQILQRKLRCIAETRASVVLSDNPGCVLHIGAGAVAAQLQVEALHPAEFLADRLHRVQRLAK